MNICVLIPIYAFVGRYSEVPVNCTIGGGIVVVRGRGSGKKDDKFWRPDDL